MPVIDELVKWYRDEYASRTAAIKAGDGRIDWLDPDARVSWTEVRIRAEQLGIQSSPVELRIQFDAALKEKRK